MAFPRPKTKHYSNNAVYTIPRYSPFDTDVHEETGDVHVHEERGTNYLYGVNYRLGATTFDLVVSSPVILPTSILAPSILARPARISFEYRGRSRSNTGIRFVDVQAIAEERVTITSESSRLDSSRVGVQISLSVHVVMVICVLD